MKMICLKRPNIIQPLFKNNGFKQKPIVLKSKVDRWREVADLVDISDHARLRLEWMIYYETVGNHDTYLTARHFGITAKTFYKWRKRFAEGKQMDAKKWTQFPGSRTDSGKIPTLSFNSVYDGIFLLSYNLEARLPSMGACEVK